MNLREKAQKYLEQSKSKKLVEEEKEVEEEWLELKHNLDESIIKVLEMHSGNIQILQIKESELYRIFKNFEFIQNVLDSHIMVLLERQKTKDDGDWTMVGAVKHKSEFNDHRDKQRFVDMKKKDYL